MFITFIIAVAFSDYYCFTHKDESKNLSINECGSKAYLKDKYGEYLKPQNYTHYVAYSHNQTPITLIKWT
jgi:hypothetical protein